MQPTLRLGYGTRALLTQNQGYGRAESLDSGRFDQTQLYYDLTNDLVKSQLSSNKIPITIKS